MTKLSEKLADLSIRVGDIEARAEAFKNEKQDWRDQRLAAMRAEVEARKGSLRESVQSRGDEISSAWTSFDQSMRDRITGVRAQIEAKKDAIDAARAERRADRLESNAMLAIDFAIIAMEDAELAALEAIDARRHADSLSA